MSVDSRGERRCDECGNRVKHVKRIHNGTEYCATCYGRVFVAAKCSKCGEMTRVHRHSQSAVECRTCTLAARVCQRCGRALPQASKLLSTGAICSPCSVQLSEPRPCELCGIMSKYLSRAPKLGISELACNRCRTLVTHKTCSFCGKHRAVASIDLNGKPRCAVCVPGNEISHYCPDCQIEVRGPGEGRCRSCLVARQILSNLSIAIAGCEYSWSRDIFEAFGKWYLSRGALTPNSVKKFAKYDIFFQRLEVAVGSSGVIESDVLLANFNSDELTVFKVPLQFLSQSGKVEINNTARMENADVDRIREIVIGSRQQPWYGLLKQYADWIAASKKAPLTSRLYLSAARNACTELIRSNSATITQLKFDRYLRHHPGQKNNLSVFATFCRDILGWALKMPNKKVKETEFTVRKLERLLVNLRDDGTDTRNSLETVIGTLLGFEKLQLRNVKWTFKGRTGRPVAMHHEDEIVKLPVGVQKLAQSWLKLETKFSGGSGIHQNS